MHVHAPACPRRCVPVALLLPALTRCTVTWYGAVCALQSVRWPLNPPRTTSRDRRLDSVLVFGVFCWCKRQCGVRCRHSGAGASRHLHLHLRLHLHLPCPAKRCACIAVHDWSMPPSHIRALMWLPVAVTLPPAAVAAACLSSCGHDSDVYSNTTGCRWSLASGRRCRCTLRFSPLDC